MPDEELWLDEAAGPLVRLYTVTNGRTRPTKSLDLLSLVKVTGHATYGQLGPEHSQVLGLCHAPTSVAEIASRLRLPVTVTKVLLSDLIDSGAVATPRQRSAAETTDRSVLEALLNGLHQRL